MLANYRAGRAFADRRAGRFAARSGQLPLLVVASATPTLGALTGVITGHGTNTAGSLVLTRPVRRHHLHVNGRDEHAVHERYVVVFRQRSSASELSSSSSSSLATTFASVGTTGPSGATLATGAGPGTEVAPDARVTVMTHSRSTASRSCERPAERDAAAFNGSNGCSRQSRRSTTPAELHARGLVQGR